jgi:hypothetical protein
VEAADERPEQDAEEQAQERKACRNSARCPITVASPVGAEACRAGMPQKIPSQNALSKLLVAQLAVAIDRLAVARGVRPVVAPEAAVEVTCPLLSG